MQSLRAEHAAGAAPLRSRILRPASGTLGPVLARTFQQNPSTARRGSRDLCETDIRKIPRIPVGDLESCVRLTTLARSPHSSAAARLERRGSRTRRGGARQESREPLSFPGLLRLWRLEERSPGPSEERSQPATIGQGKSNSGRRQKRMANITRANGRLRAPRLPARLIHQLLAGSLEQQRAALCTGWASARSSSCEAQARRLSCTIRCTARNSAFLVPRPPAFTLHYSPSVEPLSMARESS